MEKLKEAITKSSEMPAGAFAVLGEDWKEEVDEPFKYVFKEQDLESGVLRWDGKQWQVMYRRESKIPYSKPVVGDANEPAEVDNSLAAG